MKRPLLFILFIISFLYVNIKSEPRAPLTSPCACCKRLASRRQYVARGQVTTRTTTATTRRRWRGSCGRTFWLRLTRCGPWRRLTAPWTRVSAHCCILLFFFYSCFFFFFSPPCTRHPQARSMRSAWPRTCHYARATSTLCMRLCGPQACLYEGTLVFICFYF